MHNVYDLIGIGFGPANIALAVALQERAFPGTLLFLESRDSVQWHPDMMLPGSDIQNHPLRDLATPRNPRSRYTFTNYLFESNRLFEHLNLPLSFPLRAEYAMYVSWVASFFSDIVRMNTHVEAIGRTRVNGEEVLWIRDRAGRDYLARALVIALGRTPHVPPPFCSLHSPRIAHSTKYLSALTALEQQEAVNNVCVVGGSQSAVEITLDLNERLRRASVHNVLRGFGYRLKDTSPFSGQVYYPAFVDYYYNCERRAKRRLDAHLRQTNYSSADGDVVNRLYVVLYEQQLANQKRIFIHPSREVVDCELRPNGVSLLLREINTREVSRLDDLDAVILATGFRDLGTGEHQERYPTILEGLMAHLEVDEDEVLHIERDYALRPRPGCESLPPVYLNGLCEATHGFGDAGSFSLLALRADEIAHSVQRGLALRKAS